MISRTSSESDSSYNRVSNSTESVDGLMSSAARRQSLWRPSASGSTACVQHSPERQHQLALEWGHGQQSTCLGSEDTTSHFQASHEAGRNLGGLQNVDIKIFSKKLEEDGCPVADV